MTHRLELITTPNGINHFGLILIGTLAGMGAALALCMILAHWTPPRAQKRLDRVVLLGGALLSALVGQNGFLTWNQSEISATDYSAIQVATENSPNLVPAVRSALSDGRILYEEIPPLQALARQAQEQKAGQDFLQTRQTLRAQVTAENHPSHKP